MTKAILVTVAIVVLGILALVGIAACVTWTGGPEAPAGYHPGNYRPYPAATGNRTYAPPRTNTRKSLMPPRKGSGGFSGRRR
jgi:hypothetical protein